LAKVLHRTGGLAGNKNSYSITQLVIAKNRSISKLIYYNQKQRSNKDPQEVVGTTPKTPKARKEKVRSQVAEISQRKREIALGSMVGNCKGTALVPLRQPGRVRIIYHSHRSSESVVLHCWRIFCGNVVWDTLYTPGFHYWNLL